MPERDTFKFTLGVIFFCFAAASLWWFAATLLDGEARNVEYVMMMGQSILFMVFGVGALRTSKRRSRGT